MIHRDADGRFIEPVVVADVPFRPNLDLMRRVARDMGFREPVTLLPNPERLDFDAVRAALARRDKPSAMWLKLEPVCGR